ncbi:hypothetical protein [Rubrobacter aplysinae]|uniref:hypothetical protein n=1 Tax=Rubrobacter aplysinae TaxID=909625 RepID=UPI00064C0AC3|nr:hypothetical protein [Rubrobacter aplysinae]
MATSQKMDRIANTTQDMIEAQRRTYEAMTDSFIAFQKRNVEFFQSGKDLASLQEDNARTARDLMGSMGTTNFMSNGTRIMELGQRNAQFFQNWLTGGVNYLRNQAEHNQKTAEAFAKSARSQQEGLRKLGEDYFGLYEEVAQSSRSYAEEGMKNAQQATRQGLQAVQETAEQADQMARQAAGNGNGNGGNGELPISDYDSLSVSEASRRLEGLSQEQLNKVRSYEKQNKNRATVVEQIDRKIKSA